MGIKRGSGGSVTLLKNTWMPPTFKPDLTTCVKCGYGWLYVSKGIPKLYTTCPYCKRLTSINPQLDPFAEIRRSNLPLRKVECWKCGYSWESHSRGLTLDCKECGVVITMKEGHIYKEQLPGKLVRCRVCYYEWQYRGIGERPDCPKCHKVTLLRPRKVNDWRQKQILTYLTRANKQTVHEIAINVEVAENYVHDALRKYLTPKGLVSQNKRKNTFGVDGRQLKSLSEYSITPKGREYLKDYSNDVNSLQTGLERKGAECR